LTILGLIFGLFAFGLVGNYEIVSNSMSPTLQKGDRVLVDQRERGDHVEVGDIIAFADVERSGELLTKRVAARQGQSVAVVRNYLVIDGRPWAPPGQAPAPLPRDVGLHALKLSQDQLYVLGDNRGLSEDSLYFGPVPSNNVRGRLLFKYWPLGRIGWIR